MDTAIAVNFNLYGLQHGGCTPGQSGNDDTANIPLSLLPPQLRTEH